MVFDGSTTYPYNKNGKLVGLSQNPSGKKAIAYDNLGKFFQNGISYNNNVSFQGGNQKSNFFVSYANLTSTGIIPNNTYYKNNIKASGESKLTSKLKISGSVMYVNTNGNSVQQGSNLSGVMLALLRTPPSFDLSNGYSNAATHPQAYTLADGTPRDYYALYDNPYWSVNENKVETNVDRFIGGYGLTYSALDWLVFNYKFGNDIYTDRRFGYYAVNSNGGDDPPAGTIMNDYHFNSILNSDFTANIKRDITNDVKSNLLLGQNMYQFYNQQLYVEGEGINIPGFYQINNTSSQFDREIQQKKRTAALFGDLSLSFKDMLFFDGTYRKEWSTTLGAEHLSFGFPSISGGLIFTELEGLKNNEILTFGKLRASYAQTANDALVYVTKNYFTINTFTDGWTSGISSPFTNNIGTGNSFISNGILANPDLKPERTNSFEVGTDLNFWKILNLNFTYYDNHNKDQIVEVPLAGTSGYEYQFLNIGEMENKGVEITANVTPIKTKDLNWNFTINFTKNVNKVISLAPNFDAIQLNGFTGITIEAVKGKPFGEIYANSFVKDSKSRLVINDDPNDPGYGYPLESQTQSALGSYLPNWIGTFSNTLTYKGFGLNFLFEVKNGGLMWNGTLSIMNGKGTSQQTEDRGSPITFNGVKGHFDNLGNLVSSGNANDIPSVKSQWYYANVAGGFTPAQDQFVQKTDWLRLREITLSYTFDSKLLSGTKIIKSASIFATGKNLFLKTPYTGVDPETSLTGATSSQGLDYFNMPGTKGYTFGLKVVF
jgi:TonB-linked SusC/RagA family outer membrane protein